MVAMNESLKELVICCAVLQGSKVAHVTQEGGIIYSHLHII